MTAATVAHFARCDHPCSAAPFYSISLFGRFQSSDRRRSASVQLQKQPEIRSLSPAQSLMIIDSHSVEPVPLELEARKIVKD